MLGWRIVVIKEVLAFSIFGPGSLICRQGYSSTVSRFGVVPRSVKSGCKVWLLFKASIWIQRERAGQGAGPQSLRPPP